MVNMDIPTPTNENQQSPDCIINGGTDPSISGKIEKEENRKLGWNEKSLLQIKGMDEKPNYTQFHKTLEENKQTFWSLSMQEKASMVFHNITVEPFVFMSIICVTMAMVITQNLVLYKFCVNDFNYTKEVCENLKDNETLELEVQTKATNFQMYKTIVATVPMVFVVLFLGSWSDKYGRKLPMILPCVGGFLSMLIMLVNVYFMKELSPEFILIAEVPIGLTGSIGAIAVGSTSYIIDTCTPSSRTIRFAIYQAAFMCGAPIGLTIGNVIYGQVGYFPVFCVAAGLYLCSILYVLLVLKETIVSSSSLREKICSFFDLRNLRDGLKSCLKKREKNHRTHIIALIFAMMVNILPMLAEMNVAYFYMRLKFRWDVSTYTYYTTTVLLSTMIGLIFFLPLFTIRLKFSDITIGIIGALTKVCSELIVALSQEGWILFAGFPLVIFSGMNSPIVRSMLSKCVVMEEQGKLMSVVGAFESVMPIVGSVAYTQIYNTTKQTFPGTVYTVSAVLCFIPVSIFIWISRDIKKREMREKDLQVKDDELYISTEDVCVHL